MRINSLILWLTQRQRGTKASIEISITESSLERSECRFPSAVPRGDALHFVVEKIRDHLLPLDRKYGREPDCRIELFDSAHAELPEMRKLILEWMDRYLIDRNRLHNSRIVKKTNQSAIKILKR